MRAVAEQVGSRFSPSWREAGPKDLDLPSLGFECCCQHGCWQQARRSVIFHSAVRNQPDRRQHQGPFDFGGLSSEGERLMRSQ